MASRSKVPAPPAPTGEVLLKAEEAWEQWLLANNIVPEERKCLVAKKLAAEDCSAADVHGIQDNFLVRARARAHAHVPTLMYTRTATYTRPLCVFLLMRCPGVCAQKDCWFFYRLCVWMLLLSV